MRRAVRPGGWVLALAEPDYGGQIRYPEALDGLGRLQTMSLERQGANPVIGRRLMALFLDAGLEQVESGLIGGEWRARSGDSANLAEEWQVIEHDLAGWISAAELERYRKLDEAAARRGDRILFVPTFYAIGRVSYD
jgi:hypothetical protein